MNEFYKKGRLEELIYYGNLACPERIINAQTVFKNATLEKISESSAATQRLVDWFKSTIQKRKEANRASITINSDDFTEEDISDELDGYSISELNTPTVKKVYDYEKMKQATQLFIEAIGADLNNPNLRDTPNRVAKMWKVLLGGYEVDTKDHVTLFPATSDDMVTLSHIPIFSFCSHHLLPFIGTIAIAYIPNKTIIGISKLARIARVHAKKLQVQEDLTREIAADIERLLQPQGVAVQIRAQHLCTVLRGVRAQGSVMTTTHVSGLFKEDIKARNEFLDTIKGGNDVFSY